MTTRMLSVIALAALTMVSAACGGGGTTDPNPVPTVMPPITLPTPGNGFALQSVSPAPGSALGIGDGFEVRGTYTLANEELWVGLVMVRDDGQAMMWTVSQGYYSQQVPCPFSGGLTLRANTGWYDFLKGHTTNIWFVIGTAGVMGGGGVLDQSKIGENGKHIIETRYTTR